MSLIPFHPSGSTSTSTSTIDIICIPAIGACPRDTFFLDGKSWLELVCSELPTSRVLLYDHLDEKERATEFKPLEQVSEEEDIDSTRQCTSLQEKQTRWKIEDWSKRLLETLVNLKNSEPNNETLRRRPLIFICHSIGGIVLKNTLCLKPTAHDNSKPPVVSNLPILFATIGIVFFSTPHKGSQILSSTQLAYAIKNELGLKFEMGPALREQLTPKSTPLRIIHDDFEDRALELQIWNYYETQDSSLSLLVDSSREEEEQIQCCIGECRIGEHGTGECRIVDQRSAELQPNIFTLLTEVRDLPMKTNHVGTARFNGSSNLKHYCQMRLKKLVNSAATKDTTGVRQAPDGNDWGKYLELLETIKESIKVIYCRFCPTAVDSQKGTSIGPKVELSLKEFIDCGLTQIFEEMQDSSTDLASSRTDRLADVSPLSLPIRISKTTTNMQSSQSFQGPRGSPIIMDHKIIMLGRNTTILFPSQSKAIKTESMQQRLTLSISKSYLELGNVLRKTRSLSDTFPTTVKQHDKFRWIHVPVCMPRWVPMIMEAIAKAQGDGDFQDDLLKDTLWSSQHNRSHTGSSGSSHARFLRPFFDTIDLPKENDTPDGAKSRSPRSILFMPYLHWDTHDQRRRRTDIISSREKGSPFSVGEDVRSGCSLEHKLIWAYFNRKESSIHCRRTLDQYRYPSMRDTEERDCDQVFFKHSKHRAKDETGNEGAATVLMVDQLWMWVISPDTILTFFPAKEEEPDFSACCPYDQADIFTKIYDDVNGQSTTERPEDAFDFAALIVSHCVRTLLDEDHSMLSTFEAFASYISQMTEEHIGSFKEFRRQYTSTDGSQAETRPPYPSIDFDSGYLLELHDVRDELSTIQKLLDDQLSIVTMMRQQFKILNKIDRGIVGTKVLESLDNKIHQYQDKVNSMLSSVKNAETSCTQLLDMKQKQISILEAQSTLRQTEEMARQSREMAEQSRAIMIFTVITIIFLPLSYFSSVFGMNVSEWLDDAPSLQSVLEIMIGASVVVIVLALVVAFKLYTRQQLIRIITWVEKLLSSPKESSATSEQVGDGLLAQDKQDSQPKPLLQKLQSTDGILGPRGGWQDPQSRPSLPKLSSADRALDLRDGGQFSTSRARVWGWRNKREQPVPEQPPV